MKYLRLIPSAPYDIPPLKWNETSCGLCEAGVPIKYQVHCKIEDGKNVV